MGFLYSTEEFPQEGLSHYLQHKIEADWAFVIAMLAGLTVDFIPQESFPINSFNVYIFS